MVGENQLRSACAAGESFREYSVDRDAAKRVVLRQYVAGLPMGSRYQLCRGNCAPGRCVDDSPARWVNRRLHPFGVAPLRDNFELEC